MTTDRTDQTDTADTTVKMSKLAAEVADAARPHAGRHDVDGTFAAEGVEAARDSGYLAAAVPVALGGLGASTADIAAAQRTIAQACGSTALACAMHQHVVLAAAWRWNRGDTVVEPMLRKVAGGLVVVSTGGGDWTHPTTVATPVDGGWRVSGRKHFASISPAGGVAATFAVVDGPGEGAEVIAFGYPLSADGVTVDETWDAVGMRGTGSHDIVFDDVFVAEAQVTGRRTWGVLDRPLLLASLHAWPVISATYLGIAERLAAEVVESPRLRPEHARLVGRIDAELRTARWALDGAMASLGDDPDPTFDHFLTLQQMKRVVTLAGRNVAAAVAEVAGGSAYARRGPIDRMTRDLQAAIYHPYPPEATLTMVGRAAMGLDPI
jgi:alkylation response protein AidB-like acyl-CoA dehydrogenase